MARRLEYVALDDLVRAEVNPKEHDAVGLAASIERFGFVEPIIHDERTGRLIAGHGRLDDLEARRTGGAEPPEGVEIDGEGRWLAPVVMGWASKDDDEARALLVAVNRLPEAGGWKSDDLLSQLNVLTESPAGLEGTGFDHDDLAVLLRRFEAAHADPTSPDAEWSGMPEFEQGSLRAAATVTVHFPTEDDAMAFFALLRRERCRVLWWPQSDGHIGSDGHSAYVAET